MKDDLRVAGYIPTTEPYTAMGYTHAGNGGGEMIDPSILNIGGPDAIVDWVVVELRDKNDNTNILSTRSALIQRDGDIVDLNGSSSLLFQDPPDDYFVSVRHRNHLGVMSNATHFVSDVPVGMDFSDSFFDTFGAEPQDKIGTTEVMWMGNVVFDDVLKYTGLNNDRDPILVAIGGTVPTATITGYHSEDVNLDGVVKYTGGDNDRDPILVNIGGTVPTSTRDEQLP